MEHQNKPITVQKEHLQRGIDKYQGTIDTRLQQMIKAADLDYEPYLFKDGRVLLVLPDWQYGFLYPNKESLYNHLLLE